MLQYMRIEAYKFETTQIASNQMTLDLQLCYHSRSRPRILEGSCSLWFHFYLTLDGPTLGG